MPLSSYCLVAPVDSSPIFLAPSLHLLITTKPESEHVARAVKTRSLSRECIAQAAKVKPKLQAGSVSRKGKARSASKPQGQSPSHKGVKPKLQVRSASREGEAQAAST